MVATFVWPWKNDEELLEVRDLFYPAADLEECVKREKQQLAVNIVNTWKLRRSRIPHSILATADLLDAILHDDPSRNATSTIKAVYASALAKLVTSVCDLEQDGLEKRSMMEQAVRIGMPEEWVLLRHAITHGATPGLRVLQEAVGEAVPWMWGHFWRGVDGGAEDEVEVEKVRGEVKGLLEGYRRERREMIAAKMERAAGSELAAQKSKVLWKICRRRRDGEDQLVHVLVNDSIILPSEKQTNLKFKALLLVWNDLLLRIAARLPRFQAKLSNALLQLLVSREQSSQFSASPREMISKWLRHILTDSSWNSIASPIALEELRCDIAETCLLNKNRHTEAVLQDLLGVMSGQQAQTFKALMEACEGNMDDQVMELDDTIPEHNIILERTGWSRPVAVWVPRPLGV